MKNFVYRQRRVIEILQSMNQIFKEKKSKNFKLENPEICMKMPENLNNIKCS